MDALKDAEIKLSLNNRLLEPLGAAVRRRLDRRRSRAGSLLTGSVPTREDKVAATQLAWATPGVEVGRRTS